MSDSPVIEPDEILPPEKGPRPRARGRPAPETRGLFSAIIARWLDDLLKIPGTNVRFGLDPLLSLIPGLGDAVATGAGAAILFAAVRHRAPVKVLVRMVGNMVANAILNVVPLLGPALSIWYKSNARNNQMLQRHVRGLPPGPASPQSKFVFAAVILIVVAVVALNLFLWWFLFNVLVGSLNR
ncbi:MAG: DUF4112 domain-containing protein [Verrucomicrobiales bacterium]